MKPKDSTRNQTQPNQAAPIAYIRLELCTWLAALVLLMGTAVLYWPSLHNGFIGFDDPEYVVKNPHVQQGLTEDDIVWAFKTVVSGNWHPLTMISLMLDSQLFGSGPWGHHFVNVLLHSLNTALVFLVFRKLTGTFWRSWVVAALFGWHPLHVESVAWVAERKDVLSTFFWLLALWTYACFVEKRQGSQSSVAKVFYGLALLFTAFGLMSKAMLVTIPCLLLLLDYWPLGRFKSVAVRALILEKLPFFVLVVVASVITFEVQKQTGAVGSITNFPVAARVGNALISYCGYLEKCFWPNNLSIYYPYPVTGSWPVESALLAAFVIASISILSILHFKKHPYFLVGWLWYLGTLVPVIGLVQVGSQSMADRYTYVPLIGIFTLVCWGAYDLSKGLRPMKIALTLASGAILLTCLALTRQELGYWKDTETLFRRALAVTEQNYMAHAVLGRALFDDGMTDEAIPEYRKALQINRNDTDTYIGLGVALLQKGQVDAAVEQFHGAVRSGPNNPNTHFNLGVGAFRQGLADQAIAEFQETLQLDPNDPDAPGMLAKANTLKANEDALKANLMLNNQAWALATNPDPSKRDGAKAVALAETACQQTQYRIPIMVGTLAAAYAEARRFDEAVATAQKACDLATQAGETNVASRNQELIKLYQAHQAFHQNESQSH